MKKIIVLVLTLALVLTTSFGIASAATVKAKKVTITQPTAKEYTLTKGAKSTFKASVSPKGASSAVTWKSSNTAIAVVNSKGVVTGKKNGKVTITAISKKNTKIKATKAVKVVTPITSVSMTGKPVVGNTLSAKVLPAGANTTYTWYYVENGKRVQIAGEKGTTHLINPTEEGKTIQVGVAGTGYYSGTKYSSSMKILSQAEALKLKIDDEYALSVIQTLTSKKSHPELGFRMSGSRAEKEIADYIYNEYEKMGLKNVTMDKIEADGWEFKKGVLSYTNNGEVKKVSLASYQTTFVTDGPQEYELVYAGKGHKDDYKKLKEQGIDVKGKIVLIDTDQYNEYWINMPAYEAKVQGAVAVIGCENSKEEESYAMLSDEQIQVNDICGPDDAPALSVSRNTRNALVNEIETSETGKIKINLDVNAKVTKSKGSQNVWAEIPGKSKETIIIMAHYDSYFKAALDDADGTAVNMTLAKALSESGYVPEKTIRFVHHGAEEWGMSNSIYDWATGAYRQIKEVHPEWSNDAFVALNVDSFTVENKGDSEEMYKKIRINAPQLDKFARDNINQNMPEGYEIKRYDTVANNFFEDFSYMTSGIPKMLFTRSDYQSQIDTYHSSADNFEYYSNVAKQDEIIDDKVEIVGAALMAFDHQLIQPVNYKSYFTKLEGTIDTDLGGNKAVISKDMVADTKNAAGDLDSVISEINEEYTIAVKKNDKKRIEELKKETVGMHSNMSNLYKQFQKGFTRLDHDGNVVAPHEAYQNNVVALEEALAHLENDDIKKAISSLKAVDSNGMVSDFSRQTYNQTVAQKTGLIGADKMAWGKDMIEKPNQNLYKVIEKLIEKESQTGASTEYEKNAIEDAIEDQKEYLDEMLGKEKSNASNMKAEMKAISKKLRAITD